MSDFVLILPFLPFLPVLSLGRGQCPRLGRGVIAMLALLTMRLLMRFTIQVALATQRATQWKENGVPWKNGTANSDRER